MMLLDQIEAALAPLRAELTGCCILCGHAIGTWRAEVGDFKVCSDCGEDISDQLGLNEEVGP